MLKPVCITTVSRYYSEDLGRFVNRDPVGYETGGTNMYRYVRDSPTDYDDASGMYIYLMNGPAGSVQPSPIFPCPPTLRPYTVYRPVYVACPQPHIEFRQEVHYSRCWHQQRTPEQQSCDDALEADEAACWEEYGNNYRARWACHARAMLRYARCLAGEEPRPVLIPHRTKLHGETVLLRARCFPGLLPPSYRPGVCPPVCPLLNPVLHPVFH